MIDALSWLLVAEGIGLAGLPFAYAAFPALADRGWGVAKPLGLLSVSFLVWALSYLDVLPNSSWAWWLMAGVVGVAGWALLLRRRRKFSAHLRAHWRAVMAGELLFLGSFVAWSLFRAYDAAISGTEKPMDFMFLNASYRADAAPPADAWLAGEPVSYYYFGYWMFAGIAKMSGTPVFLAYNLALVLVAAMAAGAAFSLASSLVRRDGGSLKVAVLAGVAGAGLLLVVSNLMGWWELLAHLDVGGDGFYRWLGVKDLKPDGQGIGWRPEQFWWWWRASRVINTFDAGGGDLDFTIQEFPFFSFLLGDLHPHVMSVPFVLTGAVAVYSLVVSPQKWGAGWLKPNWPLALAVVLTVGTAGAINAWDLPFMGAMLLGAATLKTYGQGGLSLTGAAARAALPLAALGASGVLLMWPYYFGTLESQVQWPPLGPAEFGTRPVHFLTVWGLLLLLLLPLLAGLSRPLLRPYFSLARRVWEEAPATVDRPVLGPLIAAFIAVVVPFFIWTVAHLSFNDLADPGDLGERLVNTLPLALGVVGLSVALAARARKGRADGAQAVMLYSLLALYLLYGAELWFVHDLFGNRMNTVFKFYYQAWTVVSVAGAYGAYWWWKHHPYLSGAKLLISRAGAVLAAVLLLGCVYYPVAAAFSKANDFRASPTLDGLAYMESTAPGERRGIEWLRANARAGEVLAEAVGGGYTEFGRVSGSTGVPAVLGWPGHERQWRDDFSPFAGREGDVERLYTTGDVEEAKGIIVKYGVDYVVVGARERQKYPALITAKFEDLGTKVFSEGDFVIYKVGQGNRGT